MTDGLFRPLPGSRSGKVECSVCGGTGYPGNPTGWQAAHIRGHAPCSKCGKLLTVLLNGKPRTHGAGRCPRKAQDMSEETVVRSHTTGPNSPSQQLVVDMAIGLMAHQGHPLMSRWFEGEGRVELRCLRCDDDEEEGFLTLRRNTPDGDDG